MLGPMPGAAASLALALVALAGDMPALDCEDLRLRVSALAPAQGAVVLIELDAPGELAATWDGRPLRFWRESPRAPLRALAGVDLKRPAGEAPLLVGRTNEEPCRIVLDVRPGEFGERQLRVSSRFVELSSRDEARAAREAARLEAIFARASSPRLWKGAFRMPLDAEPTPNFGQRRILNGEQRSQHAGVDFGAPSGTRVRATQRGRVVLAASLFWSGRTVVLDHGLGLFSFYGHLSTLGVREGQLVPRGALIGRVGATGRATGPHLHWSVRLEGARVDPLELVELVEQ
jgi:murein DD-endopeptidase MepM/ murein hydrolase activator NlpD